MALASRPRTLTHEGRAAMEGTKENSTKPFPKPPDFIVTYVDRLEYISKLLEHRYTLRKAKHTEFSQLRWGIERMWCPDAVTTDRITWWLVIRLNNKLRRPGRQFEGLSSGTN